MLRQQSPAWVRLRWFQIRTASRNDDFAVRGQGCSDGNRRRACAESEKRSPYPAGSMPRDVIALNRVLYNTEHHKSGARVSAPRSGPGHPGTSSRRCSLAAEPAPPVSRIPASFSGAHGCPRSGVKHSALAIHRSSSVDRERLGVASAASWRFVEDGNARCACCLDVGGRHGSGQSRAADIRSG
jgi:hypothetical protein